jgi:MFS transporter, ACS family, tartrate transporter
MAVGNLERGVPAQAPKTDEAVGRSAIHKASWRLIPLIALGYGTAFLDRANVSFAALQMNRDLHFSATVYGFAAGIFFVSYAICEVPSNLLLCRFGARKWLSRILLTWGLLAMATMFVRTAHQFYVVRFLLGMAEAGFFPGVVYYLTQWFPPYMRARVISRFYISYPISSAVMGALAGWLLGLNGRLGLAGWQWLFMVEALPALVLSVVFFLRLPDTPSDAKWLTSDESAWLTRKIAEDAACAEHTTNVGRALMDKRVWALALVFLCMLSSGYAFLYFAPTMFVDLTGMSATAVGFLTAGVGLAGGAGMLACSASSDRHRERYWHVIVPFVLAGVGYLVCGVTHSPWVAVISLCLAITLYNSLQGALLTIPPEFLKGRTMAAGLAAMNTIGIMGGFIGPNVMGLVKDATGSYQPGYLIFGFPLLLAAAIFWWMRKGAVLLERREREAVAA